MVEANVKATLNQSRKIPVKPLLSISGEIELEVRDKNGKLIHFHKEPAKCFVANFAHWLRAFFGNSVGNVVSDEPVVDTDGVDQAILHDVTMRPDHFGGCCAPIGNSTYGLVVGGGSTPPTPDDYKLGAQYVEGTEINQFTHGATTVEAVSTTTTQSVFRVVRTFTNNYTASQTVYEVGIYMAIEGQAGTWIYICIARDVLATPTTVPAGSTLTVRYVLTFTV